MTKVLVLYHSTYGHIETMAKAVAEGAREAGETVDIKRVPETVPAELAKASQPPVVKDVERRVGAPALQAWQAAVNAAR